MSLKESIYTLAFPSRGMKSLSSGVEKAGIKGVFPKKSISGLYYLHFFFFEKYSIFFKIFILFISLFGCARS